MEGYDHPDADLDEAVNGPKFQAIAGAISQILDLVKAQGDRLAALEKVVIEDLIGGLANEGERQYKQKLGGMLREKASGLERYGGVYKQLYDKDIYDDSLENIVMPRMKEAGFDNAKLEEIISELLDHVGKRFKGLVPEDAEPVAVEVEVEKQEPAQGDDLEGVNPKVAEFLRRKRASK